MKLTSTVILAIAIAVGNFRAVAQTHGATNAQIASLMTDGEVRKIDKDAGKVAIGHGEIERLDMPAMTMVFSACV